MYLTQCGESLMTNTNKKRCCLARKERGGRERDGKKRKHKIDRHAKVANQQEKYINQEGRAKCSLPRTIGGSNQAPTAYEILGAQIL